MTNALAAALAVAGVFWLTAQAPATAARHTDAVANAVQTDMSAHRRRYRHSHRAVRVYRAPAYYGYYGPTYYERPYYRPAPMWFGARGWW